MKNKLIIFVFLYIVLFIASLLVFVHIDDNLFTRYIQVLIFSFVTSLVIYVFYTKKLTKKKNLKKIKKINSLINNFGIYFLLMSFFIFINYLTFSKHFNYFSYGFDLGIFDQAVYKYSNGIFPASSSIREISNIEADHFHPILFLYALFYKIYSSPLVLLFIQNLAFTLGGLAIYKISNFKLKSPIIGFLLVILYLTFRGNINALFFDFHPLVVAVSLFPWLFYFSLKKNWIGYFLLLIPILLSKENLSLYIVFFGFYQFFIQKERIIGLVTFILGVSYFYLVMNYFLPLMGGGGKYWSYDALGANPKELLKNVFLEPMKFLDVLFSDDKKILTYINHLESGLLFAIFSPVIIFLIPAYAQKFLSSREEFWTLNFHYSIDIYWVVAISLIFVFYYIKKYSKSKGILVFLLSFIFINALIINLYKSPLVTHRYGYFLENKNTLDKFIGLLPKNAKVSTQNAIVPHLAQRENVYIFPDLGNADYILLNGKIDSSWPLKNKKELFEYIEKLINQEKFEDIKMPYIKDKISFDSKYKLISQENYVLLFEKLK